jgi:hypothetical protein
MLFEALCYIMVEVYLVPHLFEPHKSVNKKQILIQYNAGTMLQARRSWVQFPMMSLDFSIDLILPATLWL